MKGNPNYVHEFEDKDFRYRDRLIKEGLRTGFRALGATAFFGACGFFLHKNFNFSKSNAAKLSGSAAVIASAYLGYELNILKNQAEDYLFKRFLAGQSFGD